MQSVAPLQARSGRARSARAHQALSHEPIDAPRHAGAGAEGLRSQLADAQRSAGLAELSQDIEVAQAQTDLVDQIRCELPHERGVCPQECLPGTQPVLVRDGLGNQAVQQRRDIGLTFGTLLHVQSVYSEG